MILPLCICCATLSRFCLKAERRGHLNLKIHLLMVMASHLMTQLLLMGQSLLTVVKVVMVMMEREMLNQQRSKVSLCECKADILELLNIDSPGILRNVSC